MTNIVKEVKENTERIDPLEYRVGKLEDLTEEMKEIMLKEYGYLFKDTQETNSKAAISHTVQLMEELSFIKLEITNIKERFNQLIEVIKHDEN